MICYIKDLDTTSEKKFAESVETLLSAESIVINGYGEVLEDKRKRLLVAIAYRMRKDIVTII